MTSVENCLSIPSLSLNLLHRHGQTVNGTRSVVARKMGMVKRSLVVSQAGQERKEKPSFLSLEEAGLVEISGLSTHERFLCRLTISSLNLLRVISEQEGCKIEDLNAGRLCDWFVKDKMKRDTTVESAVLQWDDSDFVL